MWRIRDVSPGSWFLPIPDVGSRISDPGSKNSNKREGWKNCKLVLKCWRKKFGPISNNYRTFYPKNCHQALKNMDLRSGIRKKPIPDPGSRGQKGTESRIRNTASVDTFSHIGFFDPALRTATSLNFSMVHLSSLLPFPACFLNKYCTCTTTYTVCNGGVIGQTDKHLPRSSFTGQFF